LSVITHHPTFCSQGGNCGRPSTKKSAAMIMAHILGRGSWQVDEALLYRTGPNKGELTSTAEMGLYEIRERLAKSDGAFSAAEKSCG
jgi:hypothetical protein